MQVSMTTTRGLERRLEIAVPGARLAGEVDARLKDIARTARLKGFRPGRVPYTVVRQQFGSQVQAEAVSELMRSTFAEAVREQKLRPAGGPRIESIAADPATELRYTAVFEVLPEVRLRPLGGVQVERPVAAIGEADIDAVLEGMRAQRPVFSEVQRAAREGDRVRIDYEGRIDGVVFPGGKGEGLALTIGAHRVLSEIEQALPGLSAGETRSITAQFPADYANAGLAGKSAQFELKLIGVEETSLPAIDEDLARAFGVREGGVPALRAEVRRSMEREVAEVARARMREQLFDALCREYPIELPQSLLESQISDLQAQAMRHAHGHAHDHSHGHDHAHESAQAPPREALEVPARRRVTLGLLLGEIIREQSLQVDRERVERRLDALSAAHADPELARRQYLASREAMEQIESAALEEQALDWALGQVRVVERPASFAELTGHGRSA